MDFFNYHQGQLHAEQLPVADLAARYGTPLYVYSRATLERHYQAFNDALAPVPHCVHYAVKANSNLAVLNVLARLGAGFDIVSGGELARVLAAGGNPAKTVFSGVGKTETEMQAALGAGIQCFNVESAGELERLNRVALALGKVAPIALRVNPDVDAKTHPYISTGLKQNKFGVSLTEALSLYQRAATLPGIAIRGMASHIGSQLLDVSPLLDALDRMLALVDTLKTLGITLHHLDVGGGLGVRYREEDAPHPSAWADAILPKLQNTGLEVHCEPGRAIAANAGILVTKVELLKPTEEKRFVVVDAAMNDLLRPTLYQAWMNIIPVIPRDEPLENCDVVGPICETGDWLARDRELAVHEGDLLAIRTAGAYGFTMASNYNSRGRAAEVMVDGSTAHLVRARESFEDLVRGEAVLPA